MFKKVCSSVVEGAKSCCRKAVQWAKNTAAAVILGTTVVVGGVAESLYAGPPSMPAVEFPIDPASIGDSIKTGGGTILMIVFTVGIGFALAWTLYRRLKRAV
jgi:hypothetical protein